MVSKNQQKNDGVEGAGYTSEPKVHPNDEISLIILLELVDRWTEAGSNYINIYMKLQLS